MMTKPIPFVDEANRRHLLFKIDDSAAFVTHGGLGPATSVLTLSELDMLDRFKEPVFEDEISESEMLQKSGEFCPGGMAELLWSGELKAYTVQYVLALVFNLRWEDFRTLEIK